MSFENKIQEWVTIDNKIKRYQDAIRHEKMQRTELSEQILSYAICHETI